MTFKEFVRESWEKIKESQKPENVQARLENSIRIEELRLRKEDLMMQKEKMRKERMQSKWGKL